MTSNTSVATASPTPNARQLGRAPRTSASSVPTVAAVRPVRDCVRARASSNSTASGSNTSSNRRRRVHSAPTARATTNGTNSVSTPATSFVGRPSAQPRRAASQPVCGRKKSLLTLRMARGASRATTLPRAKKAHVAPLSRVDRRRVPRALRLATAKNRAIDQARPATRGQATPHGSGLRNMAAGRKSRACTATGPLSTVGRERRLCRDHRTRKGTANSPSAPSASARGIRLAASSNGAVSASTVTSTTAGFKRKVRIWRRLASGLSMCSSSK